MSTGAGRPRAPVPPPGLCPTCGKPAAPKGPDLPFCSTRCKLVDLGRWLKGDYFIPGEPIGRLPAAGGDDEPEPDR